MTAAADLGGLPEDHGAVLERRGRCVQLGPVDRRAAEASLRAAAGLREGEVHATVDRELRVESDVQQSALPGGIHRRGAGDGGEGLPVRADELQGPALLGDQQSLVRKEGHSPRCREARGEGHQPDGDRAWKRRRGETDIHAVRTAGRRRDRHGRGGGTARGRHRQGQNHRPGPVGARDARRGAVGQRVVAPSLGRRGHPGPNSAERSGAQSPEELAACSTTA